MKNWQWKWLSEALVIISAQVNNVQRKLDALIAANPQVTAEQLAQLAQETKDLGTSRVALEAAIEANKPKG